MKLGQSISFVLLLEASLTSAFRGPTFKTVPARNKGQDNLARRVSPAVFGTMAASLLPHPKLANAIGIGSRVPLCVSPGGVELAINKRIGQTAILFVWTLFIMVALEWNGFEYFRHLACRVQNLGKEEEMADDVGLAKETSWDSYSHLLDPLQKRAKKGAISSRITNLFRRSSRSKVHKEKDLQKANQFFQDKQFEQHHHVVHVSRSKEEHPTYLDTLSSKYSSVDPDTEVVHDKSYLDSLSDLKAKQSTWEDYKMKVDQMKKEKLNEGEALENEVSNLQNMLQVEQSMYQTSNQALKLALDAQNQQLKLSNANNDRDAAVKNLEEFDKMANEYEQTVGKDIAARKAAGLVEDDVRSIVYEL